MNVRFIDTVPGLPAAVEEWQLGAVRITLREIIEERVRREVRRFNASRPEVYRGLIQPVDSERVLNGYRMKTLRELDEDAECRRGLEAFEKNGFLVFAAGRQLEFLDDEIELTAVQEIEFVRLLPLSGGAQ